MTMGMRVLLAVLVLLAPPLRAEQAPAVFSEAELDQMLAPLALYPDALLAQVLMASTYPGDVSDAVAWSAAHPEASGDDAVRQVAGESWDPSVQSLVAFPALLKTLGQDPAWVQRVGDAFLAQPEAVMDSVQRLRRQAKAAGNLESNEQQTVSVEGTTTVVEEGDSQQTIIIEPADPQVIYVPSYNPSQVYGSWPYPSYPPAYYPPPPGYYFGGLLTFAAGVAIIDSIWGDCDWDNGDIDIDIDHHNNINSNRQISRENSKWEHNAINRDGVPYRDQRSRERYGRQLDGAAQREALRGYDAPRAAERERARQSLERRGVQAPASSNLQARERAQAASREMQRPRTQNSAQVRQQARQQYSSRQGTRNNAFSGVRSPEQSRAYSSRGQSSRAVASRPQATRSAPVQRQARAPARSGGARRR